MADLTDFYPSPVQPSVNGAGAPAAPATGYGRLGAKVSASGGAPLHHSPALTVVALVVVSLVLLHHA